MSQHIFRFPTVILAALLLMSGCIQEPGSVVFRPAPDATPDAGQDTDTATSDDTGDAVSDVEECLGESDEELCEANGIQCGEVPLRDRCDVIRTVECPNVCAAHETCRDYQCVCIPPTGEELCDTAECGVLNVTDVCGNERSVHCGDCSGANTCGGDGQANICGVCIPKTCDDVDPRPECGQVPDGCGGLTEPCGECANDLNCSAENICTEQECEPIEECKDANAECGLVPDGCGGLLDCGGCSGHEDCGDDHQCHCIPEDDEELCQDNQAACGTLTSVIDRCGQTRNVTCGSCSDGEQCSNNQCECVGETVEELCQDNGAECGQTTATDRCGNTRNIACGGCGTLSKCCKNECISHLSICN